MPYRAVVVDVVVEVVETGGGEPSVPSRGHVGVGLIVTVEVLAQKGGPVACGVQARRHVVFLVAVVDCAMVSFPSAVWAVLVGPYPGIVSVLAAHDGGPRRAAKRVGDEGVLKAHALVLQYRSGLRHVPQIQIVFAHVV